MSEDQAFYRDAAKYYDPAYAVKPDLDDIDFYVELASSVGGKTLEVACGTGRVLIPTARAGVEIEGLDFSDPLLEILKDKLAKEPVEVQKRVALHRGDMRDFNLGKQYDLITVPFRPLQHLYSVEDQLKAFSQFQAHLKPQGKLGFNVFFPNHIALEDLGTVQYDLEWPDPEDPAIKITRSFIRRSINKLNQYFEGEFIYHHTKEEKLLEEKVVPFRMSYYTYPQIQLLLKQTGFKIAQEYGSFDKEPISICKEMIIIAQAI